MDYTKGKKCKVCLEVLTPENCSKSRTILLCNKHHTEYCYRQHKKSGNKAGKKYYHKTKNLPERKAKKEEYQKRYRVYSQQKVSARRKLKYAVDKGTIIRKPCAVCGNKTVHGHHEDYSKPLDVIWLCRKHHEELHLSKSNKNHMN